MKKSYIMVLSNEEVIISEDNPYIEIAKETIRLRPQCQKLLIKLIECKLAQKVATFDALGEALWGDDGGWGYDKKNALIHCVKDLKKIIGDNNIESVHGYGYKLCCSVKQQINTVDSLPDELITEDLPLNQLMEHVRRTTYFFTRVLDEINSNSKIITDTLNDDTFYGRLLENEINQLLLLSEEYVAKKHYMEQTLSDIRNEARHIENINCHTHTFSYTFEVKIPTHHNYIDSNTRKRINAIYQEAKAIYQSILDTQQQILLLNSHIKYIKQEALNELKN